MGINEYDASIGCVKRDKQNTLIRIDHNGGDCEGWRDRFLE